jgi:IclR family KDG regulon transcriptional repressor
LVMIDNKGTPQNTKINSVGKAISVIETIYNAQRSLSLKEISTTLGIHKSTIHHLISTLIDFGFLAQDPETRKYNIGLHLVEIGQAYLQQLDLRSIAHPFLERLAMTVGETIHLQILDRNDVVYIDKVENLSQPTALRCSSYIGRRSKAYATAAGKVLLAHLSEASIQAYLTSQTLTPKTEHTITDPEELLKQLQKIKENGFALDLQENEVGLHCVGAPIFDREANCIAALSISGPTSRMDLNRIQQNLLPMAKETAAEISTALGYT